jgi:hypothetical protein
MPNRSGLMIVLILIVLAGVFLIMTHPFWTATSH